MSNHTMSWPQRLRIARQMARDPGAAREDLAVAANDAKLGVPKGATREQIVALILNNEAATPEVPPARTTATVTRTPRPALGATNTEE